MESNNISQQAFDWMFDLSDDELTKIYDIHFSKYASVRRLYEKMCEDEHNTLPRQKQDEYGEPIKCDDEKSQGYSSASSSSSCSSSSVTPWSSIESSEAYDSEETQISTNLLQDDLPAFLSDGFPVQLPTGPLPIVGYVMLPRPVLSQVPMRMLPMPIAMAVASNRSFTPVPMQLPVGVAMMHYPMGIMPMGIMPPVSRQVVVMLMPMK